MSQPSHPAEPPQEATKEHRSYQYSESGPPAALPPEPRAEDTTVTLTGVWTITDGPDTCTLVFIPLLENTFRGHYTDVPDPSIFVAQVLTTVRGTVLNMVQTSPERQYIAAYGAHRLPSGAFAGSWTDVDGNSAEFQLTQAGPA